MSAWLREIRYAARVLWRNRTASVVAFVTLTLAIGATTAIFTVVDATLLRALPFPEADRLMQVARGYPNGTGESLSAPKFLFWREQSRGVFTEVAAYDSLGSGFNLVGTGQPERLTGSRVSAGFFTAMGVQPAIGRGFRSDEDLPGSAKVVVLSYHVWAHRFSARPDLVGQAITLNSEPYTVVGIMPEGFRYPERADVWTLFQFDPASQSRANYLEAVGRLKPGTTIEQARAAMSVVAADYRRTHPDMGTNESIAVHPLRRRLYGDMRTPLLVLLSAVGFVLLIACVNVANLQLAQASERHHEIALRSALGASTWVVVRQLLLESVLLAVISGVAGLCLAYRGVPALLSLSPVAVAQAATIGVDLRVLAFALGLSLLSGVVFGVLPAWQAARPNLDEVLRAGTRRTAGGRASAWMRRILVAGEVALALMLTIGSFLLVKSLNGLHATQPGFSIENVLTMKVSLPEAKYGRGEALAQFQERVEEKLMTTPGVRAAAVAMAVPLELGPELPFTIEGKYVPGTETGVGEAQYRPSGSAYFGALQIPLRRGRLFDSRDRRGTLPVAIVNEAAVRQYWPDRNPLGQRITVGQPFVPELADPTPREIIGVVADVRERGLNENPPSILYVPMSQQNDGLTRLAVRLLPMSVILRGEGAVATLTQSAQQAIWSVDPAQPVSDVRLMREIVSRSLGPQTFNTVLLGGLAGLALLLAAVGLYGVIAHLVGQQTREIGVRMALGATRGQVLRLFVQQALVLVVVGIAVGTAGAFGVTRFLRTLLTGISATDPWVFALAPAVLLAIAVVAALRPAWRAARIDPAHALRAD
jgi:putative ABC transport system permease protein